MSTKRNSSRVPGSPEPLNSFTPLYARIQHHLRERIQSGELKPGDRLPSESALSSQFETTRATVVRALQELVFDGTIIRRPGSGSYVGSEAGRSLDASRVHSFEQQMGLSGIAVQHHLLSFSETSASANVASHLEIKHGDPVFYLERQRLVGGQVVGLEHRYLPREIGLRVARQDLESMSVHEILEDVLSLRVIRMEFIVRAALASSHVAKYLHIRKGRPTLVREHRLIGDEARPLVFGYAIYREDFNFRYVADQSTEQPVQFTRSSV